MTSNETLLKPHQISARNKRRTRIILAILISVVGYNLAISKDSPLGVSSASAHESVYNVPDGGVTIIINNGGPMRPERGHRGPPPEAVEACSSQAVDSACSFLGRGDSEKKKGTCMVLPGKTLACVPDDMPFPGREQSGEHGRGPVKDQEKPQDKSQEKANDNG